MFSFTLKFEQRPQFLVNQSTSGKHTESEFPNFFGVKLVGKNILLLLKCFQVAGICLCYISTSSLILKDFLPANDFFILKKIYRSKFYKISYHPTNNFGRFFYFFVFIFERSILLWNCKIKELSPTVVDLSFDERFVKHYPFRLHYHKQCPINNIQVKCTQIGQNVSDIS